MKRTPAIDRFECTDCESCLDLCPEVFQRNAETGNRLGQGGGAAAMHAEDDDQVVGLASHRDAISEPETAPGPCL